MPFEPPAGCEAVHQHPVAINQLAAFDLCQQCRGRYRLGHCCRCASAVHGCVDSRPMPIMKSVHALQAFCCCRIFRSVQTYTPGLESAFGCRCCGAPRCTNTRIQQSTRGHRPASKALRRELRAVLGRSEQRLGKRVVITHPGTRIRGLDDQPVEHGQHRGGFRVEPLSHCSAGLVSIAAMPSASAVDRPRHTTCTASSLPCTSASTIFRLSRSRIRCR